ncbi:MAG: hypothetical protein ABWY34_08735, partial [Pseudoxanthomonas sp.]
MLRTTFVAATAAAVFALPIAASAAEDADIKAIREEIKSLKESYESRIQQLEDKLQAAEKAPAPAPAAAAAPTASAPTSSNAFNPAISLILGGQYSNLQRDPDTWRIGGFIPGGDEIGPGSRSFNLGESELTVSANIDPYFSGYFVLAATPENEVEVEEAYIQNSGSLPGVSVKVGRMLSGFGYLNEIHAHAWDFVDAPLVYQAFLGGQLKEDGLQARWLAPTPIFAEVGVEAGRGANFPGTERNSNGFNSAMVFAHIGDDVGASNSYRVGASY